MMAIGWLHAEGLQRVSACVCESKDAVDAFTSHEQPALTQPNRPIQQQAGMEEHQEEEEPAAPPLLRLALAGQEGMALVSVCRARVLKHQQEQDGKREEDAELAEAAREVL